MKEVKTYELQLTEDQKDKLEKLLDVIDVNPTIIKEISSSEDEFPKLGDDYYYIDTFGEVHSDTIDSVVIHRKLIGNIFKTVEEANFVAERLKVIAEMKKFAEPMNTVWDGFNNHYHIEYWIRNDSLSISQAYSYIKPVIYFDSEEAARKCINEVGEDRIKRYYIGIV